MKKIKFKVLDTETIIEENNIVRLILFLFAKRYGDIEVKVPYSKELKEALDVAKEITAVIDGESFDIIDIENYDIGDNKDPVNCPFCGKRLLEAPYIDGKGCFNVSCQNESIIGIMDILTKIDVGISVDEAGYILQMYNTRLNPKVDILTIYHNLIRRELHDDRAMCIKNKIEFFIYSCNVPSFLNMLEIDTTQVPLHHRIVDMEVDQFLELFPFTNDMFGGNDDITRFVNSVIRVNREYINRFLKDRKKIFSNYL